MRKFLAAVGAAAIVGLSASPVLASPLGDLDCADFESPIIISQGYDPFNLDADNDGIACESNPGEPVLTDLYADLRGDTAAPVEPSEELAHTGAWGPAEHPIRWMTAAAVAIVGGGVAAGAGRRMKEVSR